MLASWEWLQDYVDLKLTSEAFAHKMTMTGSKVEAVHTPGEDVKGVVVGRILQLERHPDANKLLVAQVDVGERTVQVVTGASNVAEGQFIPVALHGAALPGGKTIHKGKLRGVLSEGMMCSAAELNVPEEAVTSGYADGIWILPDAYPLGQDIHDTLRAMKVPDGTVVEFEITSNRPDCLSIMGLAREAAATLETPFTPPGYPGARAGRESERPRARGDRGPGIVPAVLRTGDHGYPDRTVARVDGAQAGSGRRALHQQYRGRDQLRDAGDGPAPPCL